MLRQREPRVKDERHLAFVRAQPCCICGAINVDAAHIRTASLAHGKRGLGMQEKASDIWTVALCRPHHDEQHSMAEMAFWKKYDLDPFMIALSMRPPK